MIADEAVDRIKQGMRQSMSINPNFRFSVDPADRFEREIKSTLDNILHCLSKFKGHMSEGEFVNFKGVFFRVAHVWSRPEGGDGVYRFQPEDTGSHYLLGGCTSFSGGLDPPIELNLKHTPGDYRWGSTWIFHDGAAQDHGVYFEAPFRVFTFTEEVPSALH